MTNTQTCSGIILAVEERQHLEPKAGRTVVGGRPALDWLLDLLRPLVEDIVLVVADPLTYLDWDVTLVRNDAPSPSRLTGLRAGLFAVDAPAALVVTSDTPLLRPPLAQSLIRTAAPRWDAVLCETASGYRPFPGVYSRRLLKVIEQHRSDSEFDIHTLVEKAHRTVVPLNALHSLDPEGISFLNTGSTTQRATIDDWLRNT